MSLKTALYFHTFMKWLMLFSSLLNAWAAGDNFQTGDYPVGFVEVIWMMVCFWAFRVACRNIEDHLKAIAYFSAQ